MNTSRVLRVEGGNNTIAPLVHPQSTIADVILSYWLTPHSDDQGRGSVSPMCITCGKKIFFSPEAAWHSENQNRGSLLTQILALLFIASQTLGKLFQLDFLWDKMGIIQSVPKAVEFNKLKPKCLALPLVRGRSSVRVNSS